MTVEYRDIEAARERIAPIVKSTPLIASATLSRMLEAEVFVKPENLQKTGSFKIRGAYNRIAMLSPAEAARGVIAASAGNHGQALACAATQAGVKATIVMPQTAAIAKIDATRGYGQTVVLEGVDYQEAHRAAERIRDETSAIFVDAYDDAGVIAGQGTIGLEIADEIEPDAVMVPVGGGGLIAGIALAFSIRAPRTEIIGVEAAGSPQLSSSLSHRTTCALESPVDTIADGLATGRIGDLPFELILRYVRRCVTVDDFEIGEAVLLMLERLKLLTEGAGAAPLAGALKLKPDLKNKRIVLCVSGSNIDINLLDRIIGHGLVKAGRLFRFSVNLRDRPGRLARLLELIGQSGANIHAVVHDRTRRDVPIAGVQVLIEAETRGLEHIESLRASLEGHGYRISQLGGA